MYIDKFLLSIMVLSTIGFLAICLFIIFLIFYGQSKSFKKYEEEQIKKVHEDAFIELGINNEELKEMK